MSPFTFKRFSLIATCFLALLLCLSLSSCQFIDFGIDLPDILDPDGNDSDNPDALTSKIPELALIDELFAQLSVYDLDREALMEAAEAAYAEATATITDPDEITAAVLKAYTAATGDIYADYYTEEEKNALTADNEGEMEGIGVSVVQDQVTLDGNTYSVLTIISVFQNSPALAAGLRVGDSVYSVVNTDGETQLVDALGYDAAISCFRGPAGTKASFTVLRPAADGEYRKIHFQIERQRITAESVAGRVCEVDPTIGIVKISQFDLTTPPQFKQTMNDLIAQGCTKFIFDVRYNPGGDLQSIEAVLSNFLEEGDIVISTQYRDGGGETDRIAPVTHEGSYATCDIYKEEIGQYRNYPAVVLTNEYTASAAELFTSNLRDYDLATLVGVTTYGKGCMQSIYDLSYFGIEGALKLTTAWYLPPCGEIYHDIGIAPDITVELPEEIIEQYSNIYLIPDAADPQLAAAIEALK